MLQHICLNTRTAQQTGTLPEQGPTCTQAQASPLHTCNQSAREPEPWGTQCGDWALSVHVQHNQDSGSQLPCTWSVCLMLTWMLTASCLLCTLLVIVEAMSYLP